MKKFYLSLFAMICSVAFTASAMGLEKSKNVYKPQAFESIAGSAHETIALKKVSKKAPASRAGFSTLEDFVGNYNWMYLNLLLENPDVASDEVEISIYDASTNSLLIEGLYGGAQLIGVVDLTAGTISIAPIKVGYAEKWQEDMIFVTCEETGTEENPVIVPTENNLVLSYTVVDEEEAFVSQSIYGVVGRTADGTYTHADGYYYLSEIAVMQRILPWIDCGEATFFDGSAFIPVFMGTDNMTAVTVPIQQSPYEGEEGVYRLVGPWDAAFGRTLNNLVFDISNPNCVVIPEQETGIIESTYGASAVMSYSGMYVGAGYTIEQFLEQAPDKNIVLNGNRIDLPIGNFFTVFAKSEYIYYTKAANGGQDGYIILPEGLGENSGVENIAVEDANAPAEFFNLQGQRVAAPVKGNFYIKRQGTTTSKVVF